MTQKRLNYTTRACLIALAASGFLFAQDAPKEEAVATKEDATITSDKETYSYGFGYSTGRRFAQEISGYGITLEDLDMEAFMAALTSGIKEEDPSFGDEQIQKAMAALGDIVQKRETELAAANLEAGKKFLEENKKREGVTTLESGLQYEVLEKGGEKKYEAPKEGEAQKEFMVSYKGTLIDGTEFDSSPEGAPIAMNLQVIPGFQEALTTMPIGAKWKLFIPSALAYGEQRRSADLAPNSVLIFELNLVEIKDAPPVQPGGGFPIQIPQGQ